MSEDLNKKFKELLNELTVEQLWRVRGYIDALVEFEKKNHK